MTDTARDLERVLASYADRAGAARPDLAARVERRFRRRRQRRVGATAAGLAAVVAAVVLSVTALHITASPAHPATSPPPSATGSLFVPPKILPLRLATDVWPQATVSIPNHTPDGRPINVLEATDATDVLAITAEPPYALYAVNTVGRTFAELSPNFDIYGSYLSVTAHWVVYGRMDGDTFNLYRMPLSGGPPRQIGTPGRPDSIYDGIWYANDTAVYWSDRHHPGVMRMPLDGGPARPMPGFEETRIVDNSGWAVQTDNDSGWADWRMPTYLTRSMRNLVTGATIKVTAPPEAAWLQCAPRFCVGGSGTDHRIFIARPDGTGRTWLDDRLRSGRLWFVGGTGVITDSYSFIYDPATGLVGGERGAWGGLGGDAEQVFRGTTLMGWLDGTDPVRVHGTYTLILPDRI